MREEGWPLPWPFPWALPPTGVTSSRGAKIANSLLDPAAETGTSVFDIVFEEASRLRASFCVALPPARSRELYLIEGISTVTYPKETLAVIYPPEFLFVIDVGLDCFVGGSVTWSPVGYGDPGFPEKRSIALRSIRSRTQANLIFPQIAGSLIIGLREGVPEDEIKKAFDAFELKNVQLESFFATANCRPFEEPTICQHLESSLSFVKYAEPNGLQRLIDFSPGWFAKRLA